MADIFKWNILKIKKTAKEIGVPEFEVYLNNLACTAVSRFTEKDLQEVKIMDKTFDFCKGDKQTLLRILGCMKGTLDMDVYLTDEQMAHLFESFPTVYSIMEFFYIEAGKRNKRYIPEIKRPQPKEEKEDKLESPYLF